MQLIIGNTNYSSWSLRPWLFVDHHGLDIEVQKLSLFSQPLLELLASHFSNNRVPLLIDGDTDVWESLAIMEYLNERFELDGWPRDARARGVARSVAGEMHSGFGALRNEAPMNIRRRFPGYQLSESARADVTRICAIWRYCRECFGQEGPWLFGRFTIVDAMYAPVVMRFRSVEAELDDNAQAYCSTLSASESMQKWIDMAYEETDIIALDEVDAVSEDIPR